MGEGLDKTAEMDVPWAQVFGEGLSGPWVKWESFFHPLGRGRRRQREVKMREEGYKGETVNGLNSPVAPLVLKEEGNLVNTWCESVSGLCVATSDEAEGHLTGTW